MTDRQTPATEAAGAGFKRRLMAAGWAEDVIDSEFAAIEAEARASLDDLHTAARALVGDWDNVTKRRALADIILAETDPPGAYGEPMQGDGRAT